jgi:hypothetical protein
LGAARRHGAARACGDPAGLWRRELPGERTEATIIATLVAFVLCAFAAMWAFAARSGWRAVWTLAVLGAIAGAIAWASIQATGRL